MLVVHDDLMAVGADVHQKLSFGLYPRALLWNLLQPFSFLRQGFTTDTAILTGILLAGEFLEEFGLYCAKIGIIFR
jgi:hypothetical protein